MVDYKFCEASDVIALTRIGDGYTKYDGLIGELLPLVVNQIQTYCRRKFVQRVYTEYLPTRESCGRPCKLYLNEMNVASSPAAIVKVDASYPVWDNVTALDASRYRINADDGVITLLTDTLESSEGAQITYTGGWPVDSNDPTLVLVPVEVAQASALQASFLLNLIVNQDTGQSVKNAQGAHKVLPLDKNAIHGIIPQARALLGRHRKQLIGAY